MAKEDETIPFKTPKPIKKIKLRDPDSNDAIDARELLLRRFESLVDDWIDFCEGINPAKEDPRDGVLKQSLAAIRCMIAADNKVWYMMMSDLMNAFGTTFRTFYQPKRTIIENQN